MPHLLRGQPKTLVLQFDRPLILLVLFAAGPCGLLQTLPILEPSPDRVPKAPQPTTQPVTVGGGSPGHRFQMLQSTATPGHALSRGDDGVELAIGLRSKLLDRRIMFGLLSGLSRVDLHLTRIKFLGPAGQRLHGVVLGPTEFTDTFKL